MDININWSEIDTVLLDMDGTLLDLHFDNYFWRQHLPKVYADKNDLSIDDTMDIIEPMFEKYSGTLNWYCVHFWSTELELDIMRHKREVANKINYRPNAEQFLTACREKVSDLRLITNGHREVLNLKIERTQIDKYFDVMLCSHELDAPKEDQKFWKNLQAEQSFEPSRTLFIDDSETVLDSASKYGIVNLLSIESPDSCNKRTIDSKYPMIGSFSHLS